MAARMAATHRPPVVAPRGLLQRKLQAIGRVTDQQETRIVRHVGRDVDDGDLYGSFSPSNGLEPTHRPNDRDGQHPDNDGRQGHRSRAESQRQHAGLRLDDASKSAETTQGAKSGSCLTIWTFIGGIIFGVLITTAITCITSWFNPPPPRLVYSVVPPWGMCPATPAFVRSAQQAEDIERELIHKLDDFMKKMDRNFFTKAQVKEEIEKAQNELKTYLESTVDSFMSNTRADLATSVKTEIEEEVMGLKKDLTIFTDTRIRETLPKNVKDD